MKQKISKQSCFGNLQKSIFFLDLWVQKRNVNSNLKDGKILKNGIQWLPQTWFPLCCMYSRITISPAWDCWNGRIPSKFFASIPALLRLVEYLFVLCYQSNSLCTCFVIIFICACICICITSWCFFAYFAFSWCFPYFWCVSLPVKCGRPLSNRVLTLNRERLSFLNSPPSLILVENYVLVFLSSSLLGWNKSQIEFMSLFDWVFFDRFSLVRSWDKFWSLFELITFVNLSLGWK